MKEQPPFSALLSRRKKKGESDNERRQLKKTQCAWWNCDREPIKEPQEMWNAFRLIYPLDDPAPSYYEGVLCPEHEAVFRSQLNTTKCKHGRTNEEEIK